MHNLKSRQSVTVESTVTSNLVRNETKPSCAKVRNDFVCHPRQFRLEFRRTREWSWSERGKSLVRCASLDGETESELAEFKSKLPR